MSESFIQTIEELMFLPKNELINNDKFREIDDQNNVIYTENFIYRDFPYTIGIIYEFGYYFIFIDCNIKIIEIMNNIFYSDEYCIKEYFDFYDEMSDDSFKKAKEIAEKEIDFLKDKAIPYLDKKIDYINAEKEQIQKILNGEFNE